MRRHDIVLAEIGKQFNVHVHTRRVRRLGLRDDMIIQVAVKKNDHVTSMQHNEVQSILRLFRTEFPEFRHIDYVMGNRR